MKAFLNDISRRWKSRAPYTEIEKQMDEYALKNRLLPIQKLKFVALVDKHLKNLYHTKITNAYTNNTSTASVLDLYAWSVSFETYQAMSEVVTSLQKLEAAKLVKLREISSDSQNVHIEYVDQIRTKAVDILLSFYVPKTQKTLEEIFCAWRKKPRDDFLRISEDMKMYARENVGRYRLILRGALAKIKTYSSTIQEALFERMYEEMRDSVGYCYSGRVSRIVNIFAGFDDNFSCDMPLSEKIGNAFSNLASSSLTLAQKLKKGRELLVQYGISDESWLEAL